LAPKINGAVGNEGCFQEKAGERRSEQSLACMPVPAVLNLSKSPRFRYVIFKGDTILKYRMALIAESTTCLGRGEW
jgi:hypothetical protein